jgi:DNA-binding transcriptional LysR family regulator
MDRLTDIEAFLAIVERGNLSAAARHLKRSLQSVSRSLAGLERSVGVELVRRTTHKTQITDAGEAFYRRVKPAFADIAEAKGEAAQLSAEPSGLLKIGAPVLLGPTYLVPLVARFLESYPKVEVELQLVDRFVDLIEENLDLAVRIGELGVSDLKARRIGRLRRVVFGAPSYLARFGRPNHPRDLVKHQCIFRSADRNAGTWQFLESGKPFSVKVAGRFHVNDAAASHAAVAAGLGISRAPLWQVQGLVDSGAAEVILAAFEHAPIPIHIVWPATRLPPARTRHFIDFLVKRLVLESETEALSK